MPRIARVVAANYPHHITQRGNNRADVFFDDDDRHCYLQLLKRYCEKTNTSIWGIKGTLVLCELIVGGDSSRHCSGWTGEQTLL
jgi:hypothetical protein